MDSRQNVFLQALRQITEEVSSEQDLDKALSILVQRIRQTTEADCCSLYIADDFRKRYRLVATDGLSQSAVGKASLKFNEGLVGVVGTKCEVLNLADAPAHPNFKYMPDVGEDEYLSFLGVPILDQNQLLGVLVVQSKQKKLFGEQEESFMITLASQVGSIIIKKKAENETVEDMQRIRGSSSTGGIAIAKALVWQPEVSVEDVKIQRCDDPMMQVELFHQALFQLQIEMDRATLKMQEDNMSNAVSGYFQGYGRLLDDTSFQDEVDATIEEGHYLATSAVKLVMQKRISKAKEENHHDLVVDIHDFAEVLTSRLVHATSREFDLSDPVILVMENMPAAMVAELPPEKIAGFVATSQSTSSHASILARDLGIPSVLGIKLDLSAIDGHTIIVDGKNGEVILDPPESVVEEFKQLANQNNEQLDLFAKEKNDKVVCLDGHHINIFLNAGLNQKGQANIVNETDGIGLYRTEISFMMCQSFPTEQQQYDWYAKLLEQFKNKPVTMRTLDIGSDKGLSYLPNKEDNPALGWRGVRVTHDMPNILHTQLRAMLRAHHKYGNLEIMVPMVSYLDEVMFVKNMMTEVAEELTKETNEEHKLPRFGVMLEVPGSCLIFREIAAQVDFFSVGSNDLIQYLLAVDRTNPKVSHYYDSFHPAVVRCLDFLLQHALETNRPITVCGELAGSPLGALLLVSLGYNSLSMNYSDLSRIKYMLRRVSYKQLCDLGKKALTLSSSDEIRQLYEQYAQEQGLGRIIELAKQEQLHSLN